MTLPEDVEQLFVGDDFGVEVDLDGFGVVSDALIGRVFSFAPRVTNASADDAREAPKLGVRAPESAEGKGGCLAAGALGALFPAGGLCCGHFDSALFFMTGPCDLLGGASVAGWWAICARDGQGAQRDESQALRSGDLTRAHRRRSKLCETKQFEPSRITRRAHFFRAALCFTRRFLFGSRLRLCFHRLPTTSLQRETNRSGWL